MIEFLQRAFVNHRQVLIKGAPGIGKSDVVDTACANVQADVITKHPSVEDPTDARGLPGKTTVNGIEVAKFFPFDDLHKLLVATKLTVCHLEDFGQAPNAVQASYMQLLLRRSLNGHKLSPHVVFVATTNDTDDKAGVGGLLEPVKSRFHTIVPLQVSLECWKDWAADHNMPPWLIAYIDSVPEALHEFKPTKALTNSPCPRNWASVGNWDNDGELNIEVWAGAVGKGRAAEAMKFRESAISMLDPHVCLADPDNAPLPKGASMSYALTVAISHHVTGKLFQAAMDYTLRISKPMQVLMVKKALKRDANLIDTQAFAIWASDPVNQQIAM